MKGQTIWTTWLPKNNRPLRRASSLALNLLSYTTVASNPHFIFHQTTAITLDLRSSTIASNLLCLVFKHYSPRAEHAVLHPTVASNLLFQDYSHCAGLALHYARPPSRICSPQTTAATLDLPYTRPLRLRCSIANVRIHHLDDLTTLLQQLRASYTSAFTFHIIIVSSFSLQA